MRPDVEIVRGDANDREHLDRVAGLLNTKALVVAYLDPARPQDLHWGTVEYLATHFSFIDMIINLSVNSLMRAILGAHAAGGRGPGAAGRFLNHDRPHELLQPSTPARSMRSDSNTTSGSSPSGFKQPARRTIHFPADNPYYDVLLVSRHERGLELWNKTNPVPVDPQMSLLLGDEGAGDPD